MPAKIIFVRHAQTTYNAEHRWQGSTDAPLTSRGDEQLAGLSERLSTIDFDMVVSSDLARARSTALAVSSDVSTDARWREPNVGTWEGLTHDEIQARYPGELRSLLDGDDVSLGGGERMSDVAARLEAAMADLVATLGDDGTALVVSHGLALLTLLAGVLGARRPTPMRLMANTAISELAADRRGLQLVSYNDVDHLTDRSDLRRSDTQILLIRHGQTQANVEQRWQGHGDWPLTELGNAQAKDLANRLRAIDALYSSPLQRAHATAQAVADEHSHEIVLDPRLKEIGFGVWENRTKVEIELDDAEAFAQLIANEIDVRRGGSGETFAEVQDRVTAAIHEIADRHTGGTVAVVSHGGATRAFVTRMLGIDFRGRYRLGSLRNTGIGRIEFGSRGPVLAHWNTLA